jgi:NitT/TauT family transport system permease protein
MNSSARIPALRGMIPVVIVLGAWEMTARFHLIPGGLFFPPFTSVLVEIKQMLFGGVLMPNFMSSLGRVAAGFAGGSVAGILVGVCMGWSHRLHRWCHPLVSLLYPIPALGWLPVLMLWIGVNEMLPITIIFICSFFPILYNTIAGIRQVPSELIDAARMLGASDRTILRQVVIPLALPNIFTGLKLEAGMAWKVVIAAEMVAIPTGIGALMMRAENLVRVDIILVCLMLLSVMSLLFEKFFCFLEEKTTGGWK